MGLPGALSELLPSHVIVYPQSSYQALRYLEGLMAPLTQPTILCIDECTPFTVSRLRQLLFVTSPDGTLLMKKLPTNLFVYICMYRSLLDSTTTTLLSQQQVALIKQSTDRNVPSLIELPRTSMRELATALYNLLDEIRENAEPPCKVSYVNHVPYVPYEACYLYVKNNDIASLWAAASGFLFYQPLQSRMSGYHPIIPRTPFIQLIRSLLTSSSDDDDLLLLFGDMRGKIQGIEANERLVLNYFRGTSIPVELHSAPYLPLKRPLLDMYDEALGQGISSQTIVHWLYEYIYNAYEHPAPLRYLLDTFSLLTSFPDVHLDNLPRHLTLLLLQALSTARHMRVTLKQNLIRNRSFVGTLRTSRSNAEVYPTLAHLVTAEQLTLPLTENGDASDVSD
ncbi:hypothetical protein GMRT_14300 [Giardia muris]|uniref:Uncharacterized protein n=1 Tax=Giardia muris TaxID=5742 RepID=A0A4Z1TC76_GIAMU|nr:hypothetical protein GMRT_14300 [Giardia muris]|eukprot:TNJ30159.1 hypothetical protein GMRT_14300 [Giardia muris]